MDHAHHSPMQGAAMAAGGVDRHKGHRSADFLSSFWVVLVATIPILGYSELFEGWGISLPRFAGSEYFILALGSGVFFYGGWVFIEGAWRELSARLPGMMTLIALAITAAYFWSVYATFAGIHTLFWELSTLIAIMLLGHWVEMKAVMSASGALAELAKLMPDTAEVMRNGVAIKIGISELTMGDRILVRPGSKVPADGTVVEGTSDLDESIITGESNPVLKSAGNEVIAGSLNGDGSLVIEVGKVGEGTFLAGVMRLVAEAERSKSRLQLLSDRAALVLTVIAVFAGGATFALWFSAGAGITFAIERLVAVLVVACPHALGLAVPLVASISTTMAAQNGFLVKRRLALETAREIGTVLFDKTGTLTEGKFSVTAVSSDEALFLASSVDARSEHPIGKAIVAEARKRGIVPADARDFRRIPGVGAEATVNGKLVFVGHRGDSETRVEVDGKEVGRISVKDTVRPEARDAVLALTRQGLRVAMITGDSEEVARAVSEELGITEFFARVLPGEKAEKVKVLQARGGRVAMVGDGVNDAPALAQADLGIAVGAGTNVAIESAGIILVRNDPRDIPKIIRLSRLTYAKMLQNLFWATGYNVIALPLAAGALYAYGVLLEPALAAVLMSASTVIVAVNAMILKVRSIPA